MIKFLDKICQKLFGQRKRPKYEKQDVHFNHVNILNKTPSNDAISKKDFIIVADQNKQYWALFRCPCGCGHVISLSLQKIHNPNWSVKKTLSGRPTVYPSVWQIKGCHSHFWIRDGRIYWVGKNHADKKNLNADNSYISMRV